MKMGTANARIVQAVHRYGYSQREIADFLDLHYVTVSRLANRRRYKKQDLTPSSSGENRRASACSV